MVPHFDRANKRHTLRGNVTAPIRRRLHVWARNLLLWNLGPRRTWSRSCAVPGAGMPPSRRWVRSWSQRCSQAACTFMWWTTARMRRAAMTWKGAGHAHVWFVGPRELHGRRDLAWARLRKSCGTQGPASTASPVLRGDEDVVLRGERQEQWLQSVSPWTFAVAGAAFGSAKVST